MTDLTKRVPHVHAEVIKAWADGAEIEYRYGDGPWCAVEEPGWTSYCQYRVKPVPHKWQKEMDAYYKEKKDIQCRTKRTNWVLWEGARSHLNPNESRFDDPILEFRIAPEEVVRWLAVNEHGSMLMGCATRDTNMKLTFVDGVLTKAEVLK